MSNRFRPWRDRRPKRGKYQRPERHPRTHRQRDEDIKTPPDLEIDRNWGSFDPDAQRP